MSKFRLRILSAEDIVVEKDRIRKEFKPEAHESLVKSILEIGLINPIIIDNGTSRLRAGECRLRAIKAIHERGETFMHAGQEIAKGFVPCIEHHELTSDMQLQLELDENLRRENLTPVEESKAISKLFEMRKKQGEKEGRKVTKGEVAEEINAIQGKPESKVSTQKLNAALLIDSMADDPEVKKAKTTKEAVKIVRKKLLRQFENTLASQQSDKYKGVKSQMLVGDMFEILPTIESETFDGIICDPPYGIEAQNFGDESFQEGHTYKDDQEYALRVIDFIIEEGFRVCKEKAHLYMFCAYRNAADIKEKLEASGWWVWPRPIIWDKGVGHVPMKDRGPRKVYECILYAAKGARQVIRIENDVISINSERKKDYAAQKPPALYRNLIGRSFLPGSKILDPTAGTGPIFTAAYQHRCIATGIEINPEAFKQLPMYFKTIDMRNKNEAS